VGIGLAVAGCASLINLGVGLVLVRAGREHRSVTLEADGTHLLTDVWTSVGVVAGVPLVAITGWERLDPIVALAVAANILLTGARLLRSSADGLMVSRWRTLRRTTSSRRWPHSGLAGPVSRDPNTTRRAAGVHLNACPRPGDWTVQDGHDLAEKVEAALRDRLPHATVFTHVEPVEDPRSFEDTELDR
jgi:cation diffusion facilitator family transporter